VELVLVEHLQAGAPMVELVVQEAVQVLVETHQEEHKLVVQVIRLLLHLVRVTMVVMAM
jgi:hypothetical protein